MKLIEWVNSKIKNLECWDMALVKLSVAAFILMVAKLWAPILSLEWYWYLVIFVLAMIKPLIAMFSS
jgi:hypothetical protein